MPSDLMTADEAAEYLRLHRDSVKRLARAGALPAAKVGRRWRFDRAALAKWVAEGGSRYEDVVDAGLADLARERMEDGEPTLTLEETRKALGL